MLPSPALTFMPLAQLGPSATPGATNPGATVTVPATPVPNPAIPGLSPPAITATGPAIAAGTQAATQGDGALPGKEAVKPESPFGGFILPIILMFVLLFLFLRRGQGKEEKRRKALLAEMKKGDKVQTVGGLIARVVSIDNDTDEVVLKVDESANVKAVYKKSAILSVIVPPDEKTK